MEAIGKVYGSYRKYIGKQRTAPGKQYANSHNSISVDSIISLFF